MNPAIFKLLFNLLDNFWDIKKAAPSSSNIVVSWTKFSSIFFLNK